jgi:hypothetical protein
MLRIRHLAALAAFAALPLFASSAQAAPCAGFSDMDDASPITGPFCNNVAWIRDRGVTLGCTTTTYCPLDNVNRLQMAAFMQRLGDALTPVIITQFGPTGAIDLDAGVGDPASHVCRTAPFTVPTTPGANFPRRAVIQANFSGLSTNPLSVFGTVTYSTDNGATWNDILVGGLTGYGMRSTVTAANHWAYLGLNTFLDLTVGTTYIFAFQVERDAVAAAPNTGDFSGGRCNVMVSIGSRTGTPPGPGN